MSQKNNLIQIICNKIDLNRSNNNHPWDHNHKYNKKNRFNHKFNRNHQCNHSCSLKIHKKCNHKINQCLLLIHNNHRKNNHNLNHNKFNLKFNLNKIRMLLNIKDHQIRLIILMIAFRNKKVSFKKLKYCIYNLE